MIVNYFLILALLLLLSGLALDAGLLEWKKMQLQSAADGAAFGALLEAERAGLSGNVFTAGMADAALNGVTNGVNNQTVTVNYPPAPANYSADFGAMQWQVSQNVRTLFMGLVSTSPTMVAAHAIVRMPPCAYFLGATSSYPSIWLASASLRSNCCVYLNSMNVDGFATATAYEFYVSGARASSNVSGSISNPPIYNSPSQTDPLASVTSPLFSLPCTFNGKTILATTTLSPATYCGGITVNNATVTLNPGLYIITGLVTLTGSTISGSGVTLFFSKGGGSNYGGINSSHSTLNLSAAATNANGAVPGIVVFGDRNWVPAVYSGSRPADFQLVSSPVTGNGIWYTPNTGLYAWQSSFSAPNYLSLVTDSLYLYGATISPLTDFSGVTGGNPFASRGGLVE